MLVFFLGKTLVGMCACSTWNAHSIYSPSSYATSELWSKFYRDKVGRYVEGVVLGIPRDTHPFTLLEKCVIMEHNRN
jgi:hypothetical protein